MGNLNEELKEKIISISGLSHFYDKINDRFIPYYKELVNDAGEGSLAIITNSEEPKSINDYFEFNPDSIALTGFNLPTEVDDSRLSPLSYKTLYFLSTGYTSFDQIGNVPKGFVLFMNGSEEGENAGIGVIIPEKGTQSYLYVNADQDTLNSLNITTNGVQVQAVNELNQYISEVGNIKFYGLIYGDFDSENGWFTDIEITQEEIDSINYLFLNSSMSTDLYIRRNNTWQNITGDMDWLKNPNNIINDIDSNQIKFEMNPYFKDFVEAQGIKYNIEDVNPNTVGGMINYNAYVSAAALTEARAAERELNDYKNNLITKLTYSELVSLRNNNRLIPGAKYRIVDYVTTTTQDGTQSAGHQFDIIVTALTNNTISEEAKACLHEEDTYFANNDLNAWKIKYCLDNDTSRFSWADDENGKGVIYYMEDEYKNKCWYDFKNIQFLRTSDFFNTNPFLDHLEDDNHYYTFTKIYDDTILDNTVNNPSNSYSINNHIGVRGQTQRKLTDIIFINSTSVTRNNIIGDSSYSCTFGDGCQDNIIADYCYNNVIGNEFKNNNIKQLFTNNKVTGTFQYNTLGIQCYNNNFSGHIWFTTFGSQFNYCSFNIPEGSKLEYCEFGSGIGFLNGIPAIRKIIFENNVAWYDTTTYVTNLETVDGRTLAEAITEEHDEQLYVYKVGDKFGVKKMSSPYLDLGSFDSEDAGCSKAASPEIVGNPNINNITFSVNGTNNKVVTIEQYSDGYVGAGSHWVTQYLNSNGKKYSRKILYYITDGVVGITNIQSWKLIIDTDTKSNGASSILYSNGKEVVTSVSLNGNVINSSNGAVDLGEIKSHDLFKRVSYQDLVYLKKNNKLVPGQKYRIFDYKTTTSIANTAAANHQFDIIVEALTTNTLSENAKACLTETPNFVSTSGYKTWSSIASSALTSISQSSTGVDKLPQEIFDLVHDNTASVLVKAAKYSNQAFDAGLYRATITYNSGSNGVNTLGAAVKNGNGNIIAIAAHRGRTGDSHRSNQYYFNVPSAGSYVFYAYYDNTIETINANTKIVIDKVSVDDYFANCDLDAWEIKYNLDNDASKYEWAVADNASGHGSGYGVIYKMIDENRNEAPYDFKNIVYDEQDEVYYTFHQVPNGEDLTVCTNTCINNVIESCYDFDTKKYTLPKNRILSYYVETSTIKPCKFVNNIFKSGSKSCILRSPSSGASIYNFVGKNYEFSSGNTNLTALISSADSSWGNSKVLMSAAGASNSLTRYGQVPVEYILANLKSDVAKKQVKLVSGSNIRTINGESLLGSEDITIEYPAATSSTMGGVIISDGFNHDANPGVLILGSATSDTIGGVKLKTFGYNASDGMHNGLKNDNGVISVPLGTALRVGGNLDAIGVCVKYNGGILTDSDSNELKLDTATTTKLGGIMLGTTADIEWTTGIECPIRNDDIRGAYAELRIGSGLTPNELGDGKLSVAIGSGLTINSDDCLAVSVGTGMYFGNDGKLALGTATTTKLGGVKAGSTLTIYNGLLNVNSSYGKITEINPRQTQYDQYGLKISDNCHYIIANPSVYSTSYIYLDAMELNNYSSSTSGIYSECKIYWQGGYGLDLEIGTTGLVTFFKNMYGFSDDDAHDAAQDMITNNIRIPQAITKANTAGPIEITIRTYGQEARSSSPYSSYYYYDDGYIIGTGLVCKHIITWQKV